MRKKGAAKLKGGRGVGGGEGGIAICSLWATGAENLEAKGERSRTVEGPCTRNRRGGPRNYEAAQVLNHIPLNAVPEAICSLWATGAENLETKGERGRTVTGSNAPEKPRLLAWYPASEGGGRVRRWGGEGGSGIGEHRVGFKLSIFQSFKLSIFQTFDFSNFQTFNLSNFQCLKAGGLKV